MAKYYTYEGKQVGYIRKMVDEVVMIEEAWSSEVNTSQSMVMMNF